MKWLAMIAFAVLAGSVLVAGPAPKDGEAPATKPAMKAVSYHRTGGFAGTNDRITISVDGKINVTGKLMKAGQGVLTPEQLNELAGLFAGWEKLKDNYPAAPGSADMFQISISWGTKTVKASAPPDQLPENFVAVCEKLEQLARDLNPPKQ